MERRGWTGYGESERDPKPPLVPPDFTGMDADEVAAIVDALLGSVMEPQWLAQWWDIEFFAGQTPRQMLEARHFRQLWLIAEATAAEDGRDITDFEHVRD